MIPMLAFIKKLMLGHKPNAAKAWRATGQDAGNAYWLYAAPVHLVLQRDSFSLIEPVPLSLEMAEVEILTSTLNKHFLPDGKQFFWFENTWFLRIEQNPQIETYDPAIVVNKDINAYMPKGVGAMAWAKFQNELQMLLFEHPVNTKREAMRLPVINSVWCYGGGQFVDNKTNHAH
jgi:hypothetical protein